MINNKLKKIPAEEVKNVVRDDDIATEIIRTNESIFLYSKENFCISNDDELIKIESALRKCERVGVFDN